MKSVSIIIPMYNSEQYLNKLFEALEQCDFYENDEVIIIDNGSTDNSREICEIYARRNTGLYKILEYTDKADSYASRNFGVKNAKGDMLVFTDSDCRPTPQWLDTARNFINEGEVMAGDIQLEVLNNGVWELYDSVAHLSHCEDNAKKNCVPTANMAVNHKDFKKVGNFEERFSGGDFEWSQRAYSKGMKIVFHKEALIYHPSRKTFEEIKKREERVAYGMGKSAKTAGKSYIPLILSYILRIFKIDRQINYSKKMRSKGAKFKDLIIFNIGFLIIRFKYVLFVSRGYKGKNPRKYGIK